MAKLAKLKYVEKEPCVRSLYTIHPANQMGIKMNYYALMSVCANARHGWLKKDNHPLFLNE